MSEILNNLNPNTQKVGGDGTVFIFTELGQFWAQVKPDTIIATVVREGNTNGVWAFPIGSSTKKRLTYINNSAILGYEFPGRE